MKYATPLLVLAVFLLPSMTYAKPCPCEHLSGKRLELCQMRYPERAHSLHGSAPELDVYQRARNRLRRLKTAQEALRSSAEADPATKLLQTRNRLLSRRFLRPNARIFDAVDIREKRRGYTRLQRRHESFNIRNSQCEEFSTYSRAWRECMQGK